MAKQRNGSSSTNHTKQPTSLWCRFNVLFLTVFIAPVFIAILVYQLDSFDPAPMPIPDATQPQLQAPMKNGQMLKEAEFVGVGELLGPEDIVYESESGLIYTGCVDGWVKRVKLNDSGVESWVNTGGRPLGLALQRRKKEVVVADAYKGLLSINKDGEVKLLTDHADGLKFKLTDGVDITKDDIIYFTDASYKYNLADFLYDLLEGKPHGRLLSYNPDTKKTKVMLKDLYFANGVAISPDQKFVVYCETPLRKCSKYYIEGKNAGKVEKFLENLPGMPDNIHYLNGHYVIGLTTEATKLWDLGCKYPSIRKVLAIVTKCVGWVKTEKNGGVFVVDSKGIPTAHYYDPALSMVTTGVTIGTHLYCGSTGAPYILRLNIS